ncbi:hypothetical protein HK099_004629 [Clydaea vesicula]|uniref:Large ribosomal subunit protein bL27m n=1 Tax=Clydaea vesicula TaxID=447962 RepID=A0AAD5Y060_9FUNG|nr:hypothetical protein HK099_004629 [Clydaea vesicula]
MRKFTFYQSMPKVFPAPLVILMGPTEYPSTIKDTTQIGSLFTLFLHAPIKAFAFISETTQISSEVWAQCLTQMNVVEKTILEVVDNNLNNLGNHFPVSQPSLPLPLLQSPEILQSLKDLVNLAEVASLYNFSSPTLPGRSSVTSSQPLNSVQTPTITTANVEKLESANQNSTKDLFAVPVSNSEKVASTVNLTSDNKENTISAPTESLQNAEALNSNTPSELPKEGVVGQESAVSSNDEKNATKKTGGSSRNGRDSNPKFLGLKKNDGERVSNGNILVRQRGYKWFPGKNVKASKDHSLHAMTTGKVRFHYDLAKQKRYVSVDDGTLSRDLLPSRDEMKKTLSDRVNAEKYLKLKPIAKYRYIRGLITEISKEKQLQKESFKYKTCTNKGFRKFNLVDLTLI